MYAKLAVYGTLRRNRAFLLFFLGVTASSLGDVIAGLGFLFVAYQLTGSAAATTGAAVAGVVPYVIFGLPGGVLSDYIPRRHVMMALDVTRAVVELIVCALFVAGHLPYLSILAAIFLLQAAGCVFNPSERALLPEIVPAADLAAANALVNVSQSCMPVLAPLITVVLLHLTGLGGFFALDALSYVVSTICLWQLRGALKTSPQLARRKLEAGARHEPGARISRGRPRGGEMPGDVGTAPAAAPASVPAPATLTLRSIPRQMAVFVRYVGAHRGLRALFLTTFSVIALYTWAWQIGLLLKAQALAGASGEQLYTSLLGLYAALSIVASLLMPLRWRRLRLGHYLLGAAVWGAGMLAIGLATSTGVLVAAILLVGLGMPICSQTRIYVLQTEVAEQFRGQGFSLSAVALYVANLVGLALFGWLAARQTPLELLFVAAGGGMLLVAAVAHLTQRSIRRVRQA